MQGDPMQLPTRASRRRELEQMSRSDRRRARRDGRSGALPAGFVADPSEAVTPAVAVVPVLPDEPETRASRRGRPPAVAPPTRSSRHDRPLEEAPRRRRRTRAEADEPELEPRRVLLPALLVANLMLVLASTVLLYWTGAFDGSVRVVTQQVDTEPATTTPSPTATGAVDPAGVRPVDELCVAHAEGSLDLESLEGRVLVSAAGGADLDAWCQDLTGRAPVRAADAPSPDLGT
ncbi:MAG: hypothetical protein IE926_19455 [Micrococcales bacterium]|nr:hypothetical protein [Micrococcales bacterium]